MIVVLLPKFPSVHTMKCSCIVNCRCFFSGNIHINVTTPDYNEEVGKLIEPFIYDWTAAHGGSVSAEHGLGKTRFSLHCTGLYFPITTYTCLLFETKVLEFNQKGCFESQNIEQCCRSVGTDKCEKYN